MLNISGINEGFVLDHIKAGMSLKIYKDLHLDKLDCTVAVIKNAKSNKMGKKDIIKVECPIDDLDLDILGFIDHNITVNVIKGDTIVEKRELMLPKQIKNVIRCKNPRCITSIEQELDQVFILTDEEKEIYRAIFYSRTATTTMMNEVSSIKENAKIVEEGGIPQIPMLLFVSNGMGTGWDKETWRSYQLEYAEMVESGNVIELDCSHYVHDYQYEKISEEIIKFISNQL